MSSEFGLQRPQHTKNSLLEPPWLAEIDLSMAIVFSFKAPALEPRTIITISCIKLASAETKDVFYRRFELSRFAAQMVSPAVVSVHSISASHMT